MPRTVFGSETQEYVDRLSALNASRAEAGQRLAETILADTTLPELDRLVLGTTLQPAVLEKWKQLQHTLEQSQGQLILADQQPRRLNGSVIGILGAVNIRHQLPVDGRTADGDAMGPCGVFMDVQLSPPRLIYKGFWGQETNDIPRVATLSAATRPAWQYDTSAPEETDVRYAGLTIGRSAIYAHPNFQKGISDLLIQFEQDLEAQKR